ncbi:hypothetical protein CL689_07475 [Candidatus Saccharibacteria bacterium]|nr:hypothetical protein [Candidatus Saccharibacteria bacterium]
MKKKVAIIAALAVGVLLVTGGSYAALSLLGGANRTSNVAETDQRAAIEQLIAESDTLLGQGDKMASIAKLTEALTMAQKLNDLELQRDIEIRIDYTENTEIPENALQDTEEELLPRESIDHEDVAAGGEAVVEQ